MAGEVFVDLTYQGLEVGRRLKLREVGPTTAYIEHGTPMPVGAQLVIATDEGFNIGVVVLRVHEQVAGAEMAPGMRVRAELAEVVDTQPARWWERLVSRDDPQVPEAEVEAEVEAEGERAAVPEAVPEAELPAGQSRDTRVMDAVELGELTEAAAAAATDDDAVAAPSGGNGRTSRGRTLVMSAAEIAEITEVAKGGGGPDDGPAPVAAKTEPTGDAGAEKPGAESGGNGTPLRPDDDRAGKKRATRRRRRR